MQVRPLLPGDLPELHARFRALCDPVRHGFPCGFDEFAEPLLAPPPHLGRAIVLVAVMGGAPVAFARIGTLERVERWALARPGDALVFGPFAAPSHTEAARALLQAARAHARETQATSVWAFDPSEAACMPAFNGGVALLPEQLPHLMAMLTREGFQIHHREICMEARADAGRTSSAVPIGLALLRGQRNGEETLSLEDASGERIGECRYSLMHPRRSMHPGARFTGYIDALAIGERHQGCGLGRLLLAEAMNDLLAMGASMVRLTTGWTNLRAQNLYYSEGFAITGSCVALRAATRAGSTRLAPLAASPPEARVY